MLSPSFKRRIEFHDLSPRGESHVFISIWRSCCHRLQEPRYYCGLFVMLRGYCYKDLCHVAKLFSADSESRAIFCHIGELSSGACRGHVIVVTWSKLCLIILKSFISLVTSEKCSPGFIWEMLSWPHGRNVPLLLQKICDLGHTAETWSRVLQRKCYLDYTAGTHSSCYKRNVFLAS